MKDDEPNVERETLRYPSEPTRTVGLRIERPGGGELGSPVAVLCHGFKGFADWGFFPALSRSLCARGFTVVAVNTSGCGVADDPMSMDDAEAFFRDTYTRQLEDIALARRWARALPGVDGNAECLFGHSRGGGMGIISAREEAPRALVTWAAIGEADRFDDATKARWRADGELLVPNARTGQTHRMAVNALDDLLEHTERFHISRAASGLRCPFLAVHGTNDATVPSSAAERLAQAAPHGRCVLLKGGDHALNARHPMDPGTSPEALPPALRRAMELTAAHFLEALGD